MRTHSFTLLPLCAAATVVAGWLAPTPVPMTRNGPLSPLAALAWANAHCDAALTKKSPAATVHADDLRRVSAHFDAMRIDAGVAAACQAARHAAARAINSDRPSYRTEVLVSVALPVH